MDIRVGAVMTAPRYECVSARNRIERSLAEAGIPLTISGGVYYHVCMQTMLEDLVSKGIDYVLTVDFDSIFTAAHVHRLLSIVSQEDQIDALAAVQPKRNSGTILASTGKAEELIFRGYPLPVKTAHFGLTVIDLAKLSTVAKPWFISTPDPSGSWGDGRTDADVHFWRAWERAGHSLYIDPGVRLGHLEEMVTYFDEDMNLRHDYLPDWEAKCDQSDLPECGTEFQPVLN